jgi:hypothetical protein
MNLALVEGLVAGLGAEGWQPALDPGLVTAALPSAVTSDDGRAGPG